MPEKTFPSGYCGFTSLPDISELQDMFPGPGDVEEYKEWFTNTAELFMSKLPEGSFVIFLQSDVRVIKQNTNEVLQWIDKSHLCSLAADRSGCTMMWHKLVALHENSPGKRSAGRPSYSHLICYAKQYTVPPSIDDIASSKTGKASAPIPVTYITGYFAIPDIFYRGEMVWNKGIGIDCCYAGVAFLAKVANATCIVDPFAGHGTVIAMANALGVDSLGIELSAKRCRKARTLDLSDSLNSISVHLRKISIDVIADRAKNAAAASAPDAKNSVRHVPRKATVAKVTDDGIVDGSDVPVEDSLVCSSTETQGSFSLYLLYDM
jgi:hypothetical protein